MNLLAIFLTGLTSGGVSCASVQGGLLASVIANQEKGELERSKKHSVGQTWQIKDLLPVASFLVAKLLSHLLLGFALGFLGEKISLSLEIKISMQIFAALFMLATAANFLELHPIFRYLSFQSPRFLRRLVKNASQSNLIFAPAVLGLLSIFIPCGVTQSMEMLAISSGNPLQGALIMGTFVLGTAPIFTAVGWLAVKLSQKWQLLFNRSAAAILIILAAYNLNASLIALDSPLTINKAVAAVQEKFSNESDQGLFQSQEKVQKITIEVRNNGYYPRAFKVKRGVPVELTLQAGNVYSCAQSFVFRSFGIATLIRANQSQTFTFTPEKVGNYTYSCSMGMYTGVMQVI